MTLYTNYYIECVKGTHKRWPFYYGGISSVIYDYMA